MFVRGGEFVFLTESTMTVNESCNIDIHFRVMSAGCVQVDTVLSVPSILSPLHSHHLCCYPLLVSVGRLKRNQSEGRQS